MWHRQAAALKRKRQERDVLFKKQAEARKQAQAEAKEAAVAALGPVPEDDDEEEGSDIGVSSKKLKPATTSKNLLPLEFLESDDEDEATTMTDATAHKPKKIKFNTVERRLARSEGRRPQDERVGSTLYRVLADRGDSKLAPKQHKYTLGMRKELLIRGRMAIQKKGFFANKK